MKIYAYEISTNRRTNHKKFDFFDSYEETNEKMIKNITYMLDDLLDAEEVEEGTDPARDCVEIQVFDVDETPLSHSGCSLIGPYEEMMSDLEVPDGGLIYVFTASGMEISGYLHSKKFDD